MDVSVVICAYSVERWDSLVAAAQSCLSQTLKAHEVIVVIDNNDELLARATRDLIDVVVTVNDSVKGLSGARNSGVAISTGDVIVFLDDDAYAEPEWLENLVRPLDDHLVALRNLAGYDRREFRPIGLPGVKKDTHAEVAK